MAAEAKIFKGIETTYNLVIVWSVITFQLGVLGATAILFLASTMVIGVLNAVRVPMTAIAAVIFMNDPLSDFKTLSLVITLRGFASYIYGTSYGNKLSRS